MRLNAETVQLPTDLDGVGAVQNLPGYSVVSVVSNTWSVANDNCGSEQQGLVLNGPESMHGTEWHRATASQGTNFVDAMLKVPRVKHAYSHKKRKDGVQK